MSVISLTVSKASLSRTLRSGLLLALLALAQGQAHADVLVVNGATGAILRFDSTGALVGTFVAPGSGGLIDPVYPAFGPDGNLYVPDYVGNCVLRYSGSTGAFIGAFVTPGSGGLQGPISIVFGPDGNLYVSSWRSQNVIRYNGLTGAPMGVFTSGGTLVVPFGLAFGPDGNLYVADEVNVLKYNGTTGAYLGVFVPGGSGGLAGPCFLVFGSDGNLYVSGLDSGVQRYNGVTGAFIDTFIPNSGRENQIAFGPDGNFYLYFGETSQKPIYRYNGQTGAFLGIFVQPQDAGAIEGFAFMPGAGVPTQVLPNHGGNAGLVTVTVVGTGLPAGGSVKLTGVGADIIGTNTTVPYPSALATTFDLTDATPGIRDMVITARNGSSSTLTGGFTVEQGGAPQVSVSIIGQNKIRIGSEQAFYIAYSNSGNVDWTGLAFVGIKLPVGIDPVTIGLTNQIVGQFHPVPLMDLQGVAAGVGTNVALVGTLLLPAIPASSSVFSSMQFTLPNSLGLSPVLIELDPFEVPPIFPPIVNIPGQFLVNLINLKGEEMGIPPPPTNQALLQALQKALTDALKDAIYKVSQNLSDHFLATTWIGKIVDAALDTINDPTLSNAKAAFKDYFDTITTGENGDFFDSALYANYSQCQELLPKGVPSCTLPKQVLSPVPVTSLDPNDKVGAAGKGTLRYLPGELGVPYSVYFDNQPTASAPAQAVTVNDTLNTNLDLTTVTLGAITFPNQVVTPPSIPLSVAPFTAIVDLRPTTNLLVKVSSSLNTTTGLLSWTFQSLDPATGLPTTDPLAGFLPPGAEGSVFFTVMPKSTLATGTVIQNTATVVFDNNAPINTPTWSNTIDNTSPSSHVNQLPATQTTTNFTVSWAGSDVGVGVQDYSIYSSDNGAAFTAWQTNVTATSATFTGTNGHTYRFYSIARDLVGNVEPTKPTADATTAVTTPPTIQCTGCYFLVNGIRATLAFNVSLVGSTSTFSYNYRTSTQAVQFVSSATSAISTSGNTATFSGQGKLNGVAGYNFTVVAKDGGGIGSGLDTVSILITGPNNYSYSAISAVAGGDVVVKE